MARATDRKVHTTCRKKWEMARRFWQPQNDMWGRLISFCLDLEHYRTSEGAVNKRASRTQPRTQRQYNLIRHKASLLLRQLPQFDTHAAQPGADANAAEASRRIVENIFYDPLRAYHDPRSRMVWAGLAGGRGVIGMDWHPKWGVCFSFRDPRRVHIQPGKTFMHDVLNPVVHEDVPMRMSEVQKMKGSGWHIPSDLNPDDWRPQHGDGNALDSRRSDVFGDEGRESDEDKVDPDDGIVTVVKSWYREDPYQRMTSKERDADLPVEEWVFVDDAMGVTFPFDPTNPMPPMSEATGAPLRLVTSKKDMYDSTDYPEGYLVVTAPFYQGEKPLFEGSWTEGAINKDAHLSAFPYAEFVGYKHPLRRTGISDTELTVSLTVVDNSTFRSSWDQINSAGGVLVALKGGLEDSEGKPFKFESAGGPIPVAWANSTMSMNAVQFFQAVGMNPAMPQFRQMVDAQWQYIGTGDFAAGLGPERSKDIAVGTANLLQQTGDLPVQLHAQELALQEAILARGALDLSRAYMGDQVISWVTDEGEIAYANVRGSDLVPLNVTVRADKEWRQQDTDRTQATAQLLLAIKDLQLPPSAMAALLKDAQISATVVTELTNAMQAGPPGMPAGSGQPQLGVVQGGGQPVARGAPQ